MEEYIEAAKRTHKDSETKTVEESQNNIGNLRVLINIHYNSALLVESNVIAKQEEEVHTFRLQIQLLEKLTAPM